MVQNAHKIKVCFFSPAVYPLFAKTDEVHGGAELQTFFLAKGLANNSEFEVSVITGNYQQNKVEKYDKVELYRGFKMNMDDGILLKFMKSLKYLFILIKIKPDIIFTTAAHATVGITAFYSKVFRKKHLHRTAHSDDVDLTWVNNNGISGKLYKYGLLKANKVITQSENHQQLLFDNHKIKAEIFRNIFDAKVCESTKEGFVLWVSRFATWKQPELFLDLAKRVFDNQFVMICPFWGEKNNEWNDFQKLANDIPNLTFIEQVAFSEIQDYFNNASLFVNTSLAEGFPNTFLQSLAGKTPIVSLNVNPDSFLEKYDCGYFCENVFENMVSYVESLLCNENEIQKKGLSGFEYIQNFHNKTLQDTQFKEIIKKLTN